MEAKPVKSSEVIMTELVLPGHTNSLKSVFGGVIMSWIDIAGAIAAQRHSGSAVVTASIDALNFIAPAYVGWIVNLKASVNFVSRTSMEVGVRADAENTLAGTRHHIASAYLTFVAIDEDKKPIEIPKLVLLSDDDRRRNAAAIARRELRLKSRAIK
jgi:acyl-CoA hydrolase